VSPFSPTQQPTTSPSAPELPAWVIVAFVAASILLVFFGKKIKR
jgi:hypothetical protein